VPDQGGVRDGVCPLETLLAGLDGSRDRFVCSAQDRIPSVRPEPRGIREARERVRIEQEPGLIPGRSRPSDLRCAKGHDLGLPGRNSRPFTRQTMHCASRARQPKAKEGAQGNSGHGFSRDHPNTHRLQTRQKNASRNVDGECGREVPQTDAEAPARGLASSHGPHVAFVSLRQSPCSRSVHLAGCAQSLRNVHAMPVVVGRSERVLASFL
jgi:hypothetical protein